MKFYKCEICGNIVAMIEDSGMIPSCCNQEMKELKPGEIDATVEKHVPQVSIDKNKVCVKVGSEEHPMTDKHFVKWIFLETNQGYQVRHLFPGDKPKAQFMLRKVEYVMKVYEYCNIHGLWKATNQSPKCA